MKQLFFEKITFLTQIRYCEPPVRRAVPLAIGLISMSNPKLNIIETLGKYSHDSDQEVAHNAIFAMGLVGAGMYRKHAWTKNSTNNTDLQNENFFPPRTNF